jgi:hypothetical protein
MKCPTCGRAHAQFMDWCSWCGGDCRVEALRLVMVAALDKMNEAKAAAYRAARIIPVVDSGDPDQGADIKGYCFASKYGGPSEWTSYANEPELMSQAEAEAEGERRWDAFAKAEQEWAKARVVLDAAKSWREQREAARERGRAARCAIGTEAWKRTKSRETARRAAAVLTDRYIKERLQLKDAPEALIDAKRTHMRLKRALKEKS